MLKNEYLVVKIGVDTAENGPSQNSAAPPLQRAGRAESLPSCRGLLYDADSGESNRFDEAREKISAQSSGLR